MSAQNTRFTWGNGQQTAVDTKINLGGFANAEIKRRRLATAEYYRRENQAIRKPCPTCQTMVQPHLQDQHDEVYHEMRYHTSDQKAKVLKAREQIAIAQFESIPIRKKSPPRVFTYKGKEYRIKGLAEKTGMPASTLTYRLVTLGLSVEAALKHRPSKRGRHAKLPSPITAQGAVL